MRVPRPFPTLPLVLAVACGAPSPAPPDSAGARYLIDPAYRRSSLEASLVNAANAYSRLRLAHYAGGDARWDALPEWNPRTEPVRARELDEGTAARTTLSPSATPLATTASVDDDDAMRALGEAAFFAYPTQLVPAVRIALGSRASVRSYGLWIDDGRDHVGGLVRAELADGSAGLAFTCASCHVDQATDTGLLVGAGSHALDLGKLVAAVTTSADVTPFLAWGPGRVDVTTSDGAAPERIPDLRPTRWLTHLHQEATVAQRDLTSLAIRLETLIITSHAATTRPPRLITWALATYLRSLAGSLPSGGPSTSATRSGAAIFTRDCVSCHAPPGLTAPPVPLAVVGTDPTLGLSADRGTGTYRVPSLHGVGTRGLLFHDASLASLDDLLDPSRTSPTFAGGTRGPGAVPGHVYGLDLSDADRADLAAYLKTL